MGEADQKGESGADCADNPAIDGDGCLGHSLEQDAHDGKSKSEQVRSKKMGRTEVTSPVVLSTFLLPTCSLLPSGMFKRHVEAGHAIVLLRVFDTWVITDPVLGRRVGISWSLPNGTVPPATGT